MQRIILIITYIITITLSSVAGSTIDVPALFNRLRTTETQELMKLGAYYDTVNEPDSALVCYSIVNDRLSGTHLSEEDQQIYCRALTNLGFLYASYYFDYTKAMMFFQKSNEESRQAGYISNLAYNYLNMAGVYLSCTQIYRNQLFEEEIWKCSEQGIETALKSEEWEVALASMVNAGLLNMQHPQPEKFRKMVADIKGVKFPADVNMLNIYLAFMSGAELFSEGNYVKALYEFRHLAEMIDINAMQGARFLITAHTAEAYTLAALGRYSEAIEKTKEYMGEAQRAGLDDEVAIGYLCLSDYYKNIGDQRGESQSLLDYHNKKDSILSAREIASIGNMPLTDQLDRLALQFQQERANKRRLSIMLWIAIPFAVLLLLFVMLLIRSQKRQRQYTKEIYKKNVTLLKEEEENMKHIKELEVELKELRASETDKAPKEGNAEKPSYQNSHIPDDVAGEILYKIKEALDDTAFICDPSFTIGVLAERIGYSYKQVSQVINDKTGSNFKTMLTERRIKEACRRLLNRATYGNYTIEHIARSVGFQSRSHFSISFKSVVGISPSDFQKNTIGSSLENEGHT